MHKALRITSILAMFFIVAHAHAVPSFARQTGLSCNVCHRNPPELTAFGRNFKINGYVLTAIPAKDKVGNSKDLLLSKYIPLSAMILLSDTAYVANQPSWQNGTRIPRRHFFCMKSAILPLARRGITNKTDASVISVPNTAVRLFRDRDMDGLRHARSTFTRVRQVSCAAHEQAGAPDLQWKS